MAMISLVNGGRIVRGGSARSNPNLKDASGKDLGRAVKGGLGVYEAYDKGSKSYLPTGQVPVRNTQDMNIAMARGQNPMMLGQAPSFSIDTTGSIPSTAINSGVGANDVLRKRNELDAQNQQLEGMKTSLMEMQNSLGTMQGRSLNPFTDPNRRMEGALYGERPEVLGQAPQLGQFGQAIADTNMGIADTIGDFNANRNNQLIQAQEQFGVGDRQRELSNTRSKLAARQAKLREDLKNFETDPANRGEARAFSQDARNRMTADAEFELANLSIIEAAQTGNLEEARGLAKDLTDRQFQEYESQIDQMRATIDAYMPMYNEEQKQEARQYQLALDEYKLKIETERDDVLERRKLMASVSAEGAPERVINQVMNARSLEEAYQAASPYIGRMDRIKMQSEIQSRNLSNLIDLAKLRQPSAIKELGLTLDDGTEANEEEMAYAAQYAATGAMPSGMKSAGVTFGRVADLARAIPKQDGTLVNVSTGIKDGKLGMEIQDDVSRLYNIIKLTEELRTLDDKRVGGVVAGTFGKVFGSNNQSKYLTKRKAIVDEIARMQTGAALTNDEQDFYNDYLPGRFSESFGLGVDSHKKIDTFKETMETKLKNALSNYNLSIYGYSTIPYDGQEFKVGQVITNEQGQSGLVQPDGSIILINQ